MTEFRGTLAMAIHPFAELPALVDQSTVHVVIETAKGSRNKYAFEEKLGVFLLKGVLPEGTSFPYDYGYIPSTKGGDGDPLDILVIMDAPAFTGCVIEVKVIGAIEAEQTERDGKTDRNDRLIGVATHAHTHDHVEALSDLRPQMVAEIEAFFEHYNRLAGKAFRPTRRSDAEGGMKLVHDGMAALDAERRRPSGAYIVSSSSRMRGTPACGSSRCQRRRLATCLSILDSDSAE